VSLSANTHIFVVAITPDGVRHWLIKPENKRDEKTGRLRLWPTWGPSEQAQPLTLEIAQIFRRRFEEENGVMVRFALSAGSEDFVEEHSVLTPSTVRGPMAFRGLLAVPGIHRGEPCWFVRFPGTSIESLRGPSPEEVINNAYERPDLLQHAEKAPTPVAPVEQKVQQPAMPRLRPGDRRG
jgi:hypothetical protein